MIFIYVGLVFVALLILGVWYAEKTSTCKHCGGQLELWSYKKAVCIDCGEVEPEDKPKCFDCRQSPDNLCAKHRARKMFGSN